MSVEAITAANIAGSITECAHPGDDLGNEQHSSDRCVVGGCESRRCTRADQGALSWLADPERSREERTERSADLDQGAFPTDRSAADDRRPGPGRFPTGRRQVHLALADHHGLHDLADPGAGLVTSGKRVEPAGSETTDHGNSDT